MLFECFSSCNSSLIHSLPNWTIAWPIRSRLQVHPSVWFPNISNWFTFLLRRLCAFWHIRSPHITNLWPVSLPSPPLPGVHLHCKFFVWDNPPADFWSNWLLFLVNWWTDYLLFYVFALVEVENCLFSVKMSFNLNYLSINLIYVFYSVSVAFHHSSSHVMAKDSTFCLHLSFHVSHFHHVIVPNPAVP